MLVSDIITQVRSDLVEPVAGFWTDAELLTWVNRAESDYVNKTRVLEKIGTLTMTQGQAAYALPADFLSIMAVFVLIDNGGGKTQWVPVYPSNLEKMRQENTNLLATDTSVQNDPKQYWLWAGSIYLYPVPKTTSQSVTIFYKCKATAHTVASETISIDDALSDGIVHYVTARAWKKEKEQELSIEASNAYLADIQNGRRWLKKLSGDQTYVMDINSSWPLQLPSAGVALPSPFVI